MAVVLNYNSIIQKGMRTTSRPFNLAKEIFRIPQNRLCLVVDGDANEDVFVPQFERN